MHAQWGSTVFRMVRRSPAIAVVIPAGPLDDIDDTIDSVLTFIDSPRKIVIINDTDGRDLGEIAARSSDIEIIEPINSLATRGGRLMENIAAAYLHLLSTFEFDVLLRMDADALIVGPGLAEVAAARFAADQRIGLLGANRIDAGGNPRDWSWASRTLSRSCGVRGLRHPQTRRLLRRLRTDAISHGYEMGEAPQGGGYIHSPALVRAMSDRGLLSPSGLAQCQLGEDQIFGLLAYACDFAIGEFSGPHGPLAVRWRGLNASPQVLINQGSLVVHSVRFFGDLGEKEIRGWFSDYRKDFNSRPADTPSRS